jgi:predicted deacylase
VESLVSSKKSRARRKRTLERRAEPFEFAEQWVSPGSIKRVDVPVARLPTGNWVYLSVIVAHGHQPGPTIWLSGAIHGDELNGVVIVDEIVRSIKPKTLSGTVLAVPIVNAFGLIQGSRYLPDRRDLNRMFPGSKRGSLGSRLAHLLSRLVIARAEFGLDFHTGSGGRTNLPQIRCNLDDPAVRKLALAFGAPVVIHSGLRDGSLRAHAASMNKPVLVFEGGEANRLDDDAIGKGLTGARQVMASVGMTEPLSVRPPAHKTQFFRSNSWVRAGRSGFCRLSVHLGQPVFVGQAFGAIVDPATGKRAPLKTKRSGTVIGRATEGLVTAGDAIINVAHEQDSDE